VDIFGHGTGIKTAEEYGVPVLGEVEIDPRIRLGGDSGRRSPRSARTRRGQEPLRRGARRRGALDEVAGTSSARRPID